VHNNYYLLRQLSVELEKKLIGFRVVSCFSQNKDELVLELNDSRSSFFIKANLAPAACCLSFPDEFRRARKNSVDLFGEVILKPVVGVRQFKNERSFMLSLADGFGLLYKMHGHFANVLLVKENQVTAIFRNHLVQDFDIHPDQLDREIDMSRDGFDLHRADLLKYYFTFGKVVNAYLTQHGFGSPDADAWQVLQQTLRLLESPTYYLMERDHQWTLSLLPFAEVRNKFESPIAALNAFADRLIHDHHFDREKSAVLQQLHVRLKATTTYLERNRLKRDELVNDHRYQQWADLVMAHMHRIAPGAAEVTLPDFYDEHDVTIKLKKDLNPQKNAEVFYRKAKNQQIEISKLQDAVAQKEGELKRLNEAMATVAAAVDRPALRQQMTLLGLTRHDAPQFENLPYHEFEFKDFKIWVGRNAEANDQLTLKHSFKEDLWLHAKDVAGSHVLIKYRAGKPFPKDVIEYAAGLAAFNSKRKTESLCPVVVTPKKYVRKRKGDPAGAVVVERETVILVPPLEVKKNG